MNATYEQYLKRFISEHIRPLSQSKFNSPEEYQKMLMLLFKGWELLEKNQTSATAKLQPVIEAIDIFDSTLSRPIQREELQKKMSGPDWERIMTQARSFLFKYQD